MKKIKFLIALTIVFIVSSCGNYTLTGDSLIEQIKKNQKIGPNEYFQQFALIDYPSNNLEKIKCQDKNGKMVWLYPDKNTEFIITKKSNGEKFKAYFDTVIFQNDTLYGLRSRLVGGLRKVAINDIDKVVVYAEMPKTEIADK